MTDTILLFLTIPVITGLIGWVTNWAAVKMIFYPVDFFGVGPVGWQGILYKQSHKFATNVATMATKNLLTAQELAKRLDLDEIEALMAETMDEQIDELCRRGAEIIKPSGGDDGAEGASGGDDGAEGASADDDGDNGPSGTWDSLPDHVKAMVTAQVKQRTRAISRELFEDMESRVDEFVDLHKLVYRQLSGANVGRLAEFTQQIGHKEFKFIEYYGGVFGFLIGLVQVTVWWLMNTWWLMPIVGILVGLITNWLAIQMIFRPQEPKKYFGLVTYQGLFAKRQKDIAADYGQVAGDELLTPHNLIESILTGPSAGKLMMMLTETISTRIDEEWKKVQPMIPIPVGDDKLAAIKGMIATSMMQIGPRIRPRLEEYLGDKMAVRETVESRLGGLPKPDFERILRGIFEEDEITLILVGGFLGGCVGVAQGMLVLATTGM